jgi:hypothetical protein
MENPAQLALDEAVLAQFVRTFSQDDTFTLLYVLTKSERPRTLEDLSRTYGGSFAEIKDRLDRLTRLKLVTRKGRAYLAVATAVIAMRSVEEQFKDARLPAVAATADERTKLSHLFPR